MKRFLLRVLACLLMAGIGPAGAFGHTDEPWEGLGGGRLAFASAEGNPLYHHAPHPCFGCLVSHVQAPVPVALGLDRPLAHPLAHIAPESAIEARHALAAVGRSPPASS